MEWVDIFIQDKYKNLLCESLNYCVEKKGLEIFCYVLMSTHLHLIARAKNDNLSDVVRDFKKFTSGKLINEIRFSKEEREVQMLKVFNAGGQKQKKKSNNQLWQYNNHAEEVYSPQFTLSKVNYIHNNPVEAGLVQYPEQYFYSSAGDYADRQGPIKVSLLNLHNLYYI